VTFRDAAMNTRVLLSLVTVFCLSPATTESAEVVNAGVGGNRSTNLLSRVDRDVVARKPTLVVIIVGTNDRLNSGGFVDARTYRKDVQTLVDRIRKGRAKVLLVTPPPCIPKLLFTRHDPRKFSDQSPNERMDEVRKILIDISKQQCHSQRCQQRREGRSASNSGRL
jgi:hypothetical protein